VIVDSQNVIAHSQNQAVELLVFVAQGENFVVELLSKFLIFVTAAFIYLLRT